MIRGWKNLSAKILDRISRETSTKGAIIEELDGLRFIAIMVVVMQHAIEPYHLSVQGGFGVVIFFVISGFILALPFAKKYHTGKRVRIRDFYLRRLTRLEPTFVIAITLWVLIKLQTKDWGLEATLLHYLATITYPFNMPLQMVSTEAL